MIGLACVLLEIKKLDISMEQRKEVKCLYLLVFLSRLETYTKFIKIYQKIVITH